MGFDINRFRDTDIKEEFICPICQDILEDPVLVQNCEHVFCRQCINEWLEKCQHKSCPIDREQIDEQSLRPPQRSFKNLITSLLISCDYHINGCNELIKIDELSVHIISCLYNPVNLNQQIECPANCGAIIRRCNSNDEHNCVIYLKTIIHTNRLNNEELVTENKRLSNDNKALNTKYNHLKDEYEEAMKQLKHFCIENKQFCNELANIRQELAINSENLNQLSDKNDNKDITIDGLNKEIQNLKKNNETLIQMLKSKDNIESRSDNCNHKTNQISNELLLKSLANDLTERETTGTNETTITTSTENKQLIDALSKRHGLSNRRVICAMLSIDRGLFAPSAVSYAMHHIRSIGYGAHTGPATYDAALLQYLEPHLTPNSKVLDIGSGTGFLTTCIASMIEPNGRVIGIEHIPQLVQQSIETIDKHYRNLKESGVIKMVLGDGRFGYTLEAPYDLIFIEPLTRRVPQKLVDQLKPGGCIVVPVGARDKDINLEIFTKQSGGEVVRLVLCDDWKLMQENTPDLLEDKKMQLRFGWKMKLGF